MPVPCCRFRVICSRMYGPVQISQSAVCGFHGSPPARPDSLFFCAGQIIGPTHMHMGRRQAAGRPARCDFQMAILRDPTWRAHPHLTSQLFACVPAEARPRDSRVGEEGGEPGRWPWLTRDARLRAAEGLRTSTQPQPVYSTRYAKGTVLSFWGSLHIEISANSPSSRLSTAPLTVKILDIIKAAMTMRIIISIAQ